MRGVMTRYLAQLAGCGLTCGSLIAEPVAPPKPPPPSKIEPGLEEAVNWKWSVAPSETKEWGMPLPAAPAPGAPGAEATAAAEPRPATYEVKKGDALIKIGRKFNMTPAQLRQFNQLKDDRIVIGQILRIPTPGELLAMEPPPPPPDPNAPTGKDGKPADAPDPALAAEPLTPQQLELETVLLQVFLDRELFSAGAIDGEGGPMFDKVSKLYQETHPENAGRVALKAKALAVVKQPYTNYTLRAEDFRFIKPRAAAPVTEPAPVKATAKKKKKASKADAIPPPPPPLSYEEMVAADFLAYSSAWEFVAERFHCNETFLRRLNERVEDPPAAGAVFQVPNVIPFEIEKALDPPLQPAADPANPVTAAVADLSLLKISRGDKLIAVMPLASARPGLHGRGSWTVLEAIPQPRMATRHEPREAPKPPAPRTRGGTPPVEPPPKAILAAGPNNPVGIVWIHLAKAKNPEPLPYGLHGTSIPARMKSQEGIGGLRLANWDIARAVRLMPVGTPLQWPADASRGVLR